LGVDPSMDTQPRLRVSPYVVQNHVLTTRALHAGHQDTDDRAILGLPRNLFDLVAYRCMNCSHNNPPEQNLRRWTLFRRNPALYRRQRLHHCKEVKLNQSKNGRAHAKVKSLQGQSQHLRPEDPDVVPTGVVPDDRLHRLSVQPVRWPSDFSGPHRSNERRPRLIVSGCSRSCLSPNARGGGLFLGGRLAEQPGTCRGAVHARSNACLHCTSTLRSQSHLQISAGSKQF